MNYIAEINAFYDWLEINSLSTSSIVLWHALMHINNKAKWTKEFTVATSVLSIKTGLAERTIREARNELKQKGRIDWRSRGGNKSAAYKITSLSAYNAGSHAGNYADSYAGSHAGNHATLNKQNETKQKNSASTKSTSEKENDLVEEFFQEVWQLYPSKKGKGRISDTKKKELYKLGDEIKRCISRYISFVKSERDRGFKDLKFQNGSTFFNSGYVDYLDENVEEKNEIKSKRPPLKVVINDNYLRG
ncbi:hypothetical protein [Senegalia massiliensis]|uniref:hypothetical protein n=1 Tax=Senegalia massiliensis TaxID=1720316 RepID=UPI001F5EB42D|nr:hypothetical protein [Senegalia massiliensis]